MFTLFTLFRDAPKADKFLEKFQGGRVTYLHISVQIHVGAGRKTLPKTKVSKVKKFLEGSGNPNFMNPFVDGKSLLGESFRKKELEP